MKRPKTQSQESNFSKTFQAKKWEIFKIAQENQAISKRIQDCKPIYSVKNMEKTYQKNQEYMKKICEFPFIFETKKTEPKQKEGKENNGQNKPETSLQKTFTFFSKLHLDSSKPNSSIRHAYTANKSKYLFKNFS